MNNLKYELPKLPYSYDALNPVISKDILILHHDKHHNAYIEGANATLENLENARNNNESVDLKGTLKNLSFNLNGHLLHSLFWKNMRTPQENNIPSDYLKEILSKNFHSPQRFMEEFSEAAKTVEGSGWAVLSKDPANNLLIMQIEKHNLLHLLTFDPILVLDVWEHAYYLDYKNDRAKFIEEWWKIVNWEDVEERLK